MHFTLIGAGTAVALAGAIFLAWRLRRVTKRSEIHALAAASIDAAAALLADPDYGKEPAAVRATAQAIIAMVQDLPVRVRNLEADVAEIHARLELLP